MVLFCAGLCLSAPICLSLAFRCLYSGGAILSSLLVWLCVAVFATNYCLYVVISYWGYTILKTPLLLGNKRCLLRMLGTECH